MLAPRNRLYLVGAVLMLLAPLCGCSTNNQVDELTVSGAWVRPTPEGSSMAAVYFTVVSPVKDELLGVSTNAADDATIHVSSADSATMTEHKGHTSSATAEKDLTLDLEPNLPMAFAPGGMHVMLMGLKSPLAIGTTLILSLEFEVAGTLNVPVLVAWNDPSDQ